MGCCLCYFVFLLLHVWIERGWPLGKVAFVFLCSLLPFAPFYLERKLKHEEASCKAEREG